MARIHGIAVTTVMGLVASVYRTYSPSVRSGELRPAAIHGDDVNIVSALIPDLTIALAPEASVFLSVKGAPDFRAIWADQTS